MTDKFDKDCDEMIEIIMSYIDKVHKLPNYPETYPNEQEKYHHINIQSKSLRTIYLTLLDGKLPKDLCFYLVNGDERNDNGDDELVTYIMMLLERSGIPSTTFHFERIEEELRGVSASCPTCEDTRRWARERNERRILYNSSQYDDDSENSEDGDCDNGCRNCKDGEIVYYMILYQLVIEFDNVISYDDSGNPVHDYIPYFM